MDTAQEPPKTTCNFKNYFVSLYLSGNKTYKRRKISKAKALYRKSASIGLFYILQDTALDIYFEIQQLQAVSSENPVKNIIPPTIKVITIWQK